MAARVNGITGGLSMGNLIFIVVLTLAYTALLDWGFRHLPRERWQILATLPLHKDSSGEWRGLNLTVYGLVTAVAYAFSVAMMIVLTGAIGAPFWSVLGVAIAILVTVAPASLWVARIVEKKNYTFTVGGAVFVGVVVAPWIVLGANSVFSAALPTLPVLTAFAIAYTLGEGTGRLACISFGCCYGKPLAQCHPLLQRVFKDKHFVFHGKTKKIAYADNLDGHKVVPIQALTCVLYVGTGLIGSLLFLYSAYTAALLFTITVTQLWRIASEFLRADFRGYSMISAYQWLALASWLLTCAYAYAAPLFSSTSHLPAPDLIAGLTMLWQPESIIFLQVLSIIVFVYSGRSFVTEARLNLYVCEDRV